MHGVPVLRYDNIDVVMDKKTTMKGTKGIQRRQKKKKKVKNTKERKLVSVPKKKERRSRKLYRWASNGQLGYAMYGLF